MRPKLSALPLLPLLTLLPHLASPASAQGPDPMRQAALDEQRAATGTPPGFTAPPAPPFDLEGHLRTAVGLSEVDGGLVGGGPGYLASFDARGFRLRAADDPSLAFGFHLESAHRGGGGVGVDAEPRFTAEATLAVARHGAALEERYELRPDGVEQSFLLHALPEGPAGSDLVLRGRVASPFAAEPGCTDGALRFMQEGEPAVRVGAVTAIDAGGARAAGSLRYDGAALELVVPAAFVERAELPLLVDPLVQLEWEVYGNGSSPDVAYDADTGLWAVCFHLAQSYPAIQRYDDLGNAVGGLVYPAGTDEAYGPPSIANMNTDDLFVVAFQEYGDANAVQVRSVDAATGVVTAPALIPLDAEEEALPQVGGDPLFPFNRAVVVYGIKGLSTAVRYQHVKTASGVAPTLEGTGDYVALTGEPRNWRVTKSNGSAGWWAATVDSYPFPSLTRRIVGTLIDTNLTDCPIDVLLEDPEVSLTQAATSGDGQNFIMVFRTEDADGQVGLEAACFERSGCALELVSSGVSLLDDPEVKPWSPDVTVVDGNYLAAWLREDAKVEAVRIDPDACAPCGPHEILSEKANFGDVPLRSLRIASRFESSFAVVDDQAMAVWNDSPYNVRAAFVEAVQQGFVVDLLGGCEDSPKFSHLGEPNLGQSFELALSNVPEGAFFANLMLSPQDVIVDVGGCGALLPSFVVPMTIDPPEMFIPVPLPCDSDIVGTTWRAQFVVGLVPGEPVTGIPGITFSNAIELTFGG